MGHVHLKVADIAATVALLPRRAGLRADGAARPQAAFLAAGGYHHHLGANTWESAGAPPHARRARAALRHATILLPDSAERERVVARVEHAGRNVVDHGGDPLVRDPSDNALVLALAG